jgi:uncharacterized membrane protein
MTPTTRSNMSDETGSFGAAVWRILRTPIPMPHWRGRPSSVDDAIVEAPEAAQGFIRKVVKKTRLWRGEKIEVAAELAGHFADGAEADVDVAQLVKDFGDPKRAARLIRRAKKRNRPIIWRALRRAVHTIVLFIALYVVSIGLVLLQKPEPKVDYLAQLNAPILAVPEEDRAWPIYRQAAILTSDWSARDALHQKFNRLPTPGEDGWDEVAAYLATQQEVLDLVREGAQRPELGYTLRYQHTREDYEYLWPEATEEELAQMLAEPEEDAEQFLISVLLPDLSRMQAFSKMLVLDTHAAAAAGDGRRVIDNIEAGFALARHSRETPILICDLVCISNACRTIESAGYVLSDHPESLTDAQLRDLAHMIAMTDELLSVRFDGERMMFQDFLQHAFTDDGEGDGRITPEGLRLLQSVSGGPANNDDIPGGTMLPAMSGPLMRYFMLSREELTTVWDRHINVMQAEAKRPMWEFDTQRIRESTEQWEGGYAQRLRHLPLTLFMAALDKSVVHAHLMRLQRDAVLVAAALESYRRDNGDWPESLDALTPGLLPSIPRDGFTGGPIGYALIAGEPVVYSCGSDRNDDGGRPPMNWRQDLANRTISVTRMIPADQLDAARAAAGGDAETDEDVWLGEGSNRYRLTDGDWILWPQLRRDLIRYDDE